MPDPTPETSRAIVKVIEEESAAFWNRDFKALSPVGWILAGPGDAAGGGLSGRRRTPVA